MATISKPAFASLSLGFLAICACIFAFIHDKQTANMEDEAVHRLSAVFRFNFQKDPLFAFSQHLKMLGMHCEAVGSIDIALLRSNANRTQAPDETKLLKEELSKFHYLHTCTFENFTVNNVLMSCLCCDGINSMFIHDSVVAPDFWDAVVLFKNLRRLEISSSHPEASPQNIRNLNALSVLSGISISRLYVDADMCDAFLSLPSLQFLELASPEFSNSTIENELRVKLGSRGILLNCL